MTPYDQWRLSGPDEDRHDIGTEDGKPCSRVPEPDEDAPRGYRPKPCEGVMVRWTYPDTTHATYCDTCGEIAQ